ncbi:MAG: VTT domain-containing protein [Gammaproteobacteria bacterium]|nr:VTT domain-containing protein [Gammaproteobacteria bacterium]MDE2346040.1 VTT domain-containing protein [Gammaproteobacteria bacterium]
MPDIPAWTHYFSLYGYLAIFLLSVIEGPLVTVFAALLAARGFFNVYAVFATVVVGDLAGDTLSYAIGRWFIARLPWRFGIRNPAFRHRISSLRAELTRQPGHYLLLGKLTHAIGFAVLLAAGATRIRYTVFVLFNMLGTVPKSGLLVLIGYFFGCFYAELGAGYRTLSLLALALGIMAALYLGRRIWTLDPPHGKPE